MPFQLLFCSTLFRSFISAKFMGAVKTKIANEFHSFVMLFYRQPMKCSGTVTTINNFQRFSAVQTKKKKKCLMAE